MDLLVVLGFQLKDLSKMPSFSRKSVFTLVL